MSMTGSATLPGAGERPEPLPRVGARPDPRIHGGACEWCGHPYALHRNGTTECTAFACTAGPDGQPCAGYVSPD